MKFDISTIFQGKWLDLSQQELFDNISDYYYVEEVNLINQLYHIAFKKDERSKVESAAKKIIEEVRNNPHDIFFDIEALLQEYSLSNEDGVTLMCLAEALLRIPDAKTVDALIQDKLSGKKWMHHFNDENSLFVNASTWGLVIAGELVDIDSNSLMRFFKKSTKPVIRAAIDRAMRIMGKHFVLGKTIQEAMKNARSYNQKGYDHSYDMLGESAITREEANRYYHSYCDAIKSIAMSSSGIAHSPTLSIKLSALHPRLEEAHRDRVLDELSITVTNIVRLGIQNGVGITIDAEEADRLELTLSLFEQVYSNPFIGGWGKFGLVIQAYSKRALPALCWLTKLAKTYGDVIPVRLVKGAYWDTEIQHAQIFGLAGYPVFTKKEHTDTSYLACARYLLSDLTRGLLYPQFASHNAHSVSSIKAMVPADRDFEYQRLHGMGDKLYDSVLSMSENNKVRIYAPVGSHEDLLPYLVRRLLENGANSSFVHQLSDKDTTIEGLAKQPLVDSALPKVNADLPIELPSDIFPCRKNSSGINLASMHSRSLFMKSVSHFNDTQWISAPIINGETIHTGSPDEVRSPYDNNIVVGKQYKADDALVVKALDIAENAVDDWQNQNIEWRCKVLETTADLLEMNKVELVALCQREAGKTIQDSIDEIREAVDFCRYYAEQARVRFVDPIVLPGPAGESNEIILEGRGIFVCISPWNFPLAIFIGQIVAALVAGNVVIVKPAENTSLIAYRAVELLFEAGLPSSALQFLTGSGSRLGSILNADTRVAGVVFTGSNKTARSINQMLSSREENAGIATLIAETGGLNAMIVDSTALPEQVARDVVDSAFKSAGQRCSALRILYVQEDIADRVVRLIKGMMDELSIGNPQLLKTDIGPVIDKRAQQVLLNYIDECKISSKNFYQVVLPETCDNGTFVAPTLFEINSIKEMKEEQFGPILHVVHYRADDIDQVINDINSKRYGLTFGIHTRNKSLYERIAKQIKVGNVYINRNQIGAVVGVNPFGGCGLSGTGPKAGGPHYLLRFVTEKTVTNNTAAIGGNIDLLNAV